eukprot:scaffold430902_cov22-Prasinocladus_malaysianus.AAC.1
MAEKICPWDTLRQVSKDGSKFASFCSDKKVRVFRFLTGKLYRAYDESLEVRLYISSSAHNLPCRLY